jgi:hypothetical protein
MEKDDWSKIGSRKFLFFAILMVAVLALPSFLYTGAYIISDAPAPKNGLEMPPSPDEKLSEGLLFIVLDGGRQSLMDSQELMPNLHAKKRNGTYIDVLTNPMTMTASCVKEMATGIPSRPNEGLNNFHPDHPGTQDGWTLASEHDGNGDGVYDYRVGIVGDYVWGDLYADNEKINFMKHRYGHADYYQGDEESFVTLNAWLDGEVPKSNTRPGTTYEEPPNVIIAHLSGLDSVGHRYAVKNSDEYAEKLTWLDNNFATVFDKVPDTWTVVVTADHGLTDSGQHGSPDLEIREVGAWMWGPNVKQNYYYPEQIDQRDLATLPSLLFSLPLPHAVHGKFPLDAFDLSEEKHQELEQWNWNSTVSRNEWMQENGHPYFEGLTRENIEWEKISHDEIGLRSLDLIISTMAFLGISAGIFVLAKRQEISQSGSIKLAAVFSLGFIFSMIVSFNRDTLALPYYMVGYILPIVFFAICGYTMMSKKLSEQRRMKFSYALLIMFVTIIIFTESRISAINILMLIMLFTPIFRKPDENKKSANLIRWCFTIAIIPITLLSHYRVFYWSMPRGIINLSIQQDLIPGMMNTGFIILGILFYQINTKSLDTNLKKYSVVGLFSSIPTLMILENNMVDWILLSSMIIVLVYATYLKIKKIQQDIELVTIVVFCWLTMSWGGYVGAISIVLYVSFKSFFNNELNFLFEKSNDLSKQIPQVMIMTLLPLVIWYSWWAALGQIGGFYHPRDVDPGSLYLNGGYIGDRFSPSNSWVGFMGGGPAAAMSILWFSLFYKAGFNIRYVAYFLIARLAMLSLQLSISPNLPRLIFKLSWDIIFALGLLGFMIHVLVQDRIKNKNQKSIDAILTQ